ncbi:hypothetical protein QTP88_010303 [Uroleucon formosanum]
MNMDNTSNESCPSRSKRFCRMNRNYEQQIEQMLFKSDSDENYDFSNSDSEYEFENIEQVSDDFESDNQIANSVPSVNTQSSTNINNDGSWQKEEIELSNFPFIKKNELLVPIEGVLDDLGRKGHAANVVLHFNVRKAK